MKKMNQKGFTMAELLIVVAIIAVLVAIAIPIFTTQLEKSREATDEANIRAAYAEVTAAALSEDTNPSSESKITYDGTAKTWTKTVTAKQSTTSSWVSGTNPDIGGVSVAPAASWSVVANSEGKVTISAPTSTNP